MQKALMASSSSPKSKLKPGNQLKGHVSNFTHNQKMQQKITSAFILNKKLLHFQRSLAFTFDLKREVDSSSFSVTKNCSI